MKDKDFIEVSEYVREQRKIFITPALIERVAENNSFLMATKIISQSSAFDLGEAENLYAVNLKLSEKLSEIYESVKEKTPYPEIIQILEYRHEFRNLKKAFEFFINPQENPPILTQIGSVPINEYTDFFAHQDPFESKLPDYLLISAQTALENLKGSDISTQAAGSHFVHDMYALMHKLAEKINHVFISDITATMIDFYNSKTLLKAKVKQKSGANLEQDLIENGKTSLSFFVSGYTKSLAAAIPAIYHKKYSANINFAIQNFERTDDFLYFESLFTIILRQIINTVELVSYGAEVPFSFLLNVEHQVYQINLLLDSILKQKPAQSIIDYFQINLKKS